MVIQKQNHTARYTKSGGIFLIGILVLVLVIWFGILIQKSQNDILSLSNQIQSEAIQLRKKSNVRVQRNTTITNTGTQNTGLQNTGFQNGTGITTNTGN